MKSKLLHSLIFLSLLVFSPGIARAIFFPPPIISHILDNATGGDCTSIGTWDSATKTCRLSVDTLFGISIDADGVTLDGLGHSTSASVSIFGRFNTTLKNIFVLGSGNAVSISNSASTTISGIATPNAGTGIYVDTSPATTIVDNTIQGNNSGITLSHTIDVTIFHNNFLGNSVLGNIWNADSVVNMIVSQDLPTGGNYYAHHPFDQATNSTYSCNDTNADGVCDSSFVTYSSTGQIIDNFPWVQPNGWRTYVPPPVADSNVLFLPGLEASRLYAQTPAKCPLNCEDQLWEPNIDSDGVGLYLNASGTSTNPNIYTKDIIKTSNTPVALGPLGLNIYKSFSDTMDSLVANHTIAQWKAFAYDWRRSPSDVVSNPQAYDQEQMISLVGTLQSLVNSSKNGKVTIVAHSNGGIVAKVLLKKLEDDKAAGRNTLIDHIDVVILVAVPQLGTPLAIPAVLHGYDQSLGFGLLLTTPTAREIGRNMPSAYTLLPSAEYYNHVSTPVTYFVPNIFDPYMTTDVTRYGQSISTYSAEKSFLTGGDGRSNPGTLDTLRPIVANADLLAQAESIHSSIDTMTLPPSIRLIQVAGWGLDTVAGFQYNASTTCVTNTAALGCTGRYVLDETPVFTADGDTVAVSPSALSMGGEKWWLDLNTYDKNNHNNEHKTILEVFPLLNFISNTIQHTTTSVSYLSTTTPLDTTTRLRLSVHSPVTLDAYDALGNHTGKVCPPTTDLCYIEQNIPNSSYLEFGEGKYLNVPQDAVQKISLQGTDAGTFTFDSQVVAPSGQTTTSSFVDIPVTPQTQADITLNPATQTPQLALDVTGDGITDFTLTPTSTFDPVTYLQIMKATADSLDLTQAKINAFDKRVDNIIKLIQKGKVDKVKLKVDNFKTVLENKLSKPDPKKPRPKRLSKADAQTLLDMLNTLLDNLS